MSLVHRFAIAEFCIIFSSCSRNSPRNSLRFEAQLPAVDHKFSYSTYKILVNSPDVDSRNCLHKLQREIIKYSPSGGNNFVLLDSFTAPSSILIDMDQNVMTGNINTLTACVAMHKSH